MFNTAAIEMIADEKSPLFMADIASNVKTAFAEVFDNDVDIINGGDGMSSSEDDKEAE